MLNIIFSTGVVLECWKHTINVMLEKDKGSPKLHRLWIIQLFETNYNFLLALVSRHRLMKFARTYFNFNDTQYSSMNGKQTQSAILNKILTYDYFRLRRENAATAQFDAVENYDQILPAVAVISCQRLGIAQKGADLIYDSFKDLCHCVQTIYGLLEEYGPSVDFPMFGSG